MWYKGNNKLWDIQLLENNLLKGGIGMSQTAWPVVYYSLHIQSCIIQRFLRITQND